ncbi:leucine-rich repeat LGI family member 4-like [Agelaius tricolor]|uniref:leucine-rich repeat LGI family member 4-like n=1 Tax=Agelaius tricolor TaxID=9191 RepID=UPI0039F23FBA
MILGGVPVFGGGVPARGGVACPKGGVACPKGGVACPGGCDCDRSSARCRGGAGGVPRGLPPKLATLSLIRWDLEELPQGSFRHLPALTLLLLSSGRVGSIGDGAFDGLGMLEYLFIEDSQLGSVSPGALRGLRGLQFLSLANNNLESLPRDLFRDLGTLRHLDLRGNPLRCDCALRWLLAWGGSRPSPPEGRCRGPLPHLGTALAQLRPQQLQCQRRELRPFQSLPFSSLGAEPVSLQGHPGVFLAQPALGACALLEWDQLGGRFRAQSVINGSSPVSCHPVPVGDTLLLVVAQLRGGSWVWRRSGGPGSSFVRHQSLGQGHLRRPHAVTAARLGGHLYLGVADSSKGGTSTVFRWASGAFYPHQALRPWRRDTHLEFLELGGRAALVVCSAARRPQVYLWSGGGFVPHTDIPHVPDVYAAKHFRVRGSVFLCLTRFLGDAKVMRWEGSMFREVQAVPARGSLVFQPLLLAGHRYVLLGNDFAPSRVFRLGAAGRLEPEQELPAPSPRAFVPVAAGHRHFLLATSFKGATQVYAHVTEDVGT